MVKSKQKPLAEIKDVLKSYSSILNVGCGGCASVCLAGGQREVIALNNELSLLFKQEGLDKKIDGYTVERQCNVDFFQGLSDERIKKYDCIISMACGAGVQFLAEAFKSKPVFPALNTVSIGIDKDIGLYEERCRACGECVLAYTGGICPVTRCAKGLFNGPCGGTNRGKCEIGNEYPCAWYEIYERLKEQNRLQDIKKIQPAMLWKNQVLRVTIQEPYQERYKMY
ncbi:MAG: methylenetetrahydrofolate reductase C-terminal domain-containing protein [Desulfobacterales bacterium]|nr:methylenetetrahydrofolate reductase C-terminal domain-containing protein [Desulfobacterales bacterium]